MQMNTRSLQGIGFGIALAGLVAVPPFASAAPSNVAIWSNIGLGLQTIGGTVGTAGDFNCDGVSDLLLGGPDSDLTAGGAAFWTNVGWVGIHFGGVTLPPQPNDTPDWVVVGNSAVGTNQTGARAGARLAAGDVNRDGCDDVITTTESTLGAGELVQVYFGSPGGPSTSFGWRRFIGSFGSQISGSVASGDVNGDGTADIIVGAPDATNGQANEGMVLVWLGSQFLASNPDGVGNPDWFAESNQGNAGLGTSVSSGDVNGDGRDDIVAGAPGWDGSFVGTTDTGIALMWSGSPVLASAVDGTPANASWSFQIGSPAAHLGASISVAGDLDGDGFADIVMGAPNYDNFATAGTNEGAVIVSRGASPAPPTDVYSWTHPGQVSGARLGYAVASAGDVNGDGRADYLMSEPDIQVAGFVRGRVHLVLGRPTASWTINPVSDVLYTEADTGNATFPTRYAWAIGTAGDWNNDGFSDVVIGAPWKNSFSGQAFVYPGRGDTLKATSSLTMRNGQADSSLGLGVAFAGDINHDGFTDIIGGAPNYEDSPAQNGEGRFFVGYGGRCEPDCTSPFSEIIFPGQREGNQAGAQLGWSVSSAGDVNGDGFADVVAGAPLYDGFSFPCPIFQTCPVPDAGLANIYLGGGGGLAFTPSLSINGANQLGSQFGYSVANAGDVNGDGYGDVIVGAPYYNAAAGADEGRVFLYLGSAAGLSSSPSWIKSGGQVNAHFGIDVAGAGDVNGDGFSDVIIGADGFGATGAAFVYLGRPTNPSFPQGLSDTPIRTLVGLQAGSSFGLTVATAGDLNRDGFADVVVGAPTYFDDPEFGLQIGMVNVYHGASGGPLATATFNIYGPYSTPGAVNRFGNGVAGAGDVNGDGYGDLIVGDQWFEGPAGFAQGSAYVFHGSPSGITSSIANRTFQDCPTGFCDFGRDVAGAGDLNGDGISDVLIAAYGYTEGASREGGVFVHLGNEGRGRSMELLQSLGFSGAPRAILGATADNFDAVMNLKSPAGRTRAEFELEVKSIGQNFDALGTLKSGLLDNSLNGRTSLTVLGIPGSVYQWRARVRSASPLFGRSRWISLPENAPREMDIRVLPEPGIAAALFTGIGALAGLARRRRRASGLRSGGEASA